MNYFLWTAGVLWILLGLLTLDGSDSAVHEILWTSGVLWILLRLAEPRGLSTNS